MIELLNLTNNEGFLTDYNLWTPEIALAISVQENIRLGDDH